MPRLSHADGIFQCLAGPLSCLQNKQVYVERSLAASQQHLGNRSSPSSAAPTLAQPAKRHSEAAQLPHREGAKSPSFLPLGREAPTWGGPDRFYEEVLTAPADGFYGEVLTCQWHIDALEVQLSLLEEVAHCDAEAVTLRGTAALQRCLVALEEQHASAVDSLWERVAPYIKSMSVHSCNHSFARSNSYCTNSTGADEILGKRDVPRCFERCLRAAEFTYAGIAEETRALVEALALPGEDVNLCGLTFCEGVSHGGRIAQHYWVMWQRLSFWVKRLEETWKEWEKATECMHNACDNSASIWSDRFHNPLDVHPTLLQGLANDRARAFEVKLSAMTRATS